MQQMKVTLPSNAQQCPMQMCEGTHGRTSRGGDAKAGRLRFGFRSGFTLIELLVVIAIIALLIGILIPSLGKARDSARTLKCLTHTRAMGQIMTLYANDNKSWYPQVPECVNDGFLGEQSSRGGLAGLFSLNQVGFEDDGLTYAGWTGQTPTDDNDQLDCYPLVSNTGPAGCTSTPLNGPRTPLLRNYMTGFDILICPSDKQDVYYGPAVAQGGAAQYSPTTWTGTTGFRNPRVAGSERQVAWNSISYLYITGLKTDEPNIPTPPPLFGDETNGPDVGTKAWYGASAGSTTLNAQMGAAGVTFAGGYGKVDNHGAAGANFVYADGSGKFTTGSIQDIFFSSDPQAQKSINVIKPGRSAMTQTID
jgi:prepilin-type N-terminal cleavage/methylation domain-containing protein